MNITGLSYFKLFLLLKVHKFDIVCLQETWLTHATTAEFDVPGYTQLEYRREKGKRGGIAIFVRKSLPILAS